jgi:hypothetical protein
MRAKNSPRQSLNCRGENVEILSAALANASAREPPIILHADLSAAEKVGHCRDRFSCALRAGANGKDKVAEGKFLTGLEDLFVLFHTISLSF